MSFPSEICKLPYCQECGEAYKLIVIVVIFILFYYVFLKNLVGDGKMEINDMMNYKVFEFPLLENCCSWWPISHFVLFLLLGLLFPDCGLVLLGLGIGWELFEVAMDYMSGRKRQKIKSSSAVEYSRNWWAGSIKDVIMNIAGFMVGWMIAKKLNVKWCIHNINSRTKWCSNI